jgi:hypothetical protein
LEAVFTPVAGTPAGVEVEALLALLEEPAL